MKNFVLNEYLNKYINKYKSGKYVEFCDEKILINIDILKNLMYYIYEKSCMIFSYVD